MGRDRSLPRRSAVCGAQFRAVVGGLGAAVPSRQVMTAMLDDSKLKFTPLAGYALAATSIALATLAGKVLDPVQADPFPFVPFLAAVLIAALAMAGFAIHSLAVPRSAKALCGGQRARSKSREDEAQLWLAAIVDCSGEAIIGKTVDGTITNWNAGAERLYGYAATEAVGRPISMLLPPGREDELERIMAILRNGKPVEHYETIRRRKNGELIDVSVTVVPVRDSTGRVVGASAIVRDITLAKRAAYALGDSEKRYRAMFDALLDGLLTLNERGGDRIGQSGCRAPVRLFGGGIGGAAPVDADSIARRRRGHNGKRRRRPASARRSRRRSAGASKRRDDVSHGSLRQRGTRGRQDDFHCRRPRRHRAPLGRRGPSSSQGGRGGSESSEEPVSGQCEPRAANADECHPGYDRVGAGRGPFRGSAGLLGDGEGVCRGALGIAQRYSRIRADRSRRLYAGGLPVQPP